MHGVYDWGFDLCHMVWERGVWSAVAPVSHTAGFPDKPFTVVRMAGGGVALAYQYSNYPPDYWHFSGATTQNVSHSAVAVTRLPWGGNMPPVRQIGPGRLEALRAGSPDLVVAPRLSISGVDLYLVPASGCSEARAEPPAETRAGCFVCRAISTAWG